MRIELATALRRLDYVALCEVPEPYLDDEERYLAVRSRLILGRYEEAAVLLARLSPEFSPGSWLPSFLNVQLRTFRREHRDQCLIELAGLSMGMAPSAYLRGEYYFFLGYLHNLLDEYKQGSRYHRLAVTAYGEAQLEACAGVALFNLCVAFDHLNARDLLESTLRELSALAERLELASVSVLALHFQAYLAIDGEEYLEGATRLLEVYWVSHREGRRRECGAVAWLIAYCYLKVEDDGALDRFRNETDPHRPSYPHEYRVVLDEVYGLASRGILDGGVAQESLRRWKKLGIDTVPQLFLTDLLLDRLSRGLDYEAVLRVAHHGHEAILRRQMALSLLDFRYYEALACFKLGEDFKGRRLRHAYAHDALESGCSRRLEKARALELRFSVSATVEPRGEESLVRLDVRRHELRHGNLHVDLTAKVRIEKLLETLMRSKRMLPIDEVFHAVYGDHFSPFRHEARLNSLVARVREVVGSESFVLRRDGMLGVNPKWQCEVTAESEPGVLAIERRHQRILRFIRSAAKPVRVSDLESLSDFSRRTLQMDLNHLVKQRLLSASGNTRGRVYSVREMR